MMTFRGNLWWWFIFVPFKLASFNQGETELFPIRNVNSEIGPHSAINNNSSLHKAFSLSKPLSTDREGSEGKDLALVISSFLLKSSSNLQECSLAVLSDQYFYMATDLFLRQLMKGNGDMSNSLSVSFYVLPPATIDKDREDDITVLGDYYGRVGKETCTNYVFLLENSHRLLRLLEDIYEESLDLLAKFIIISNIASTEVKAFLQTSPISKIVNMILATPFSQEGIAMLQLRSHAFFRNNKRISAQRLGTWRRDNTSNSLFEETINWFPEKLRDFHGFQFRATTFNHPPVSIFEPKEDGTISYDGLEIRLLMTLASSLNFTVKISKPRDGQKWGSKLPDGSWTGAMGETVRGDTDVSFANYFITSDRLKIIDMTRPYYIDYTCFITPVPQPLPQYTAVAWPFEIDVWIGVLLMFLLVPPMVRLAGALEAGQWFKSLNNTFLYVWGIFLIRPQPLVLEPHSTGLRIVVIFSWIAAMVMAVAYKSSLIAFLLVPLPAQPVNTLDDLLESGLKWGVRDTGGWGQWFSNSIDPRSRKIAEGFEFVRGIDGGLARVLQGDFAFMNSGTFLRYLVASNFTDEHGQTELHVTRECFVPFRIGLGMPRFSIYTSKFNAVVGRVVEGGMVARWFQDLLTKAEKKQRIKSRNEKRISETQNPTVGKDLSLYHVQGPFILLFTGWMLSALCYLLEILHYNMYGRKKSVVEKPSSAKMAFEGI